MLSACCRSSLKPWGSGELMFATTTSNFAFASIGIEGYGSSTQLTDYTDYNTKYAVSLA